MLLSLMLPTRLIKTALGEREEAVTEVNIQATACDLFLGENNL